MSDFFCSDFISTDMFVTAFIPLNVDILGSFLKTDDHGILQVWKSSWLDLMWLTYIHDKIDGFRILQECTPVF